MSGPVLQCGGFKHGQSNDAEELEPCGFTHSWNLIISHNQPITKACWFFFLSILQTRPYVCISSTLTCATITSPTSKLPPLCWLLRLSVDPSCALLPLGFTLRTALRVIFQEFKWDHPAILPKTLLLLPIGLRMQIYIFNMTSGVHHSLTPT